MEETNVGGAEEVTPIVPPVEEPMVPSEAPAPETPVAPVEEVQA